MTNERTTQRQDATTKTEAMHGLQELELRGMYPTPLTTIHGHHIGNGRMHTKQESEGWLDMIKCEDCKYWMFIPAWGVYGCVQIGNAHWSYPTKADDGCDKGVKHDHTRKSGAD